MAVFIKLTRSSAETPVFINVDLITEISPFHDMTGKVSGASIRMSGDPEICYVAETPDQVLKKANAVVM